MARGKRKPVRKKFVYFFLNGKVHKVISRSRARDELIAWCYPDRKRVLYSYAQVEKYMEAAYTIKQAGVVLNKHKVTIQDYILEGKVRVPQKVYPIGDPESEWYKYMLSESDIIEIHQFILDVGHSNEVPSKAELRAILKNNLILYTKTEEGNFVPVWKAE